jgi:ATP-dependent Zn protease
VGGPRILWWVYPWAGGPGFYKKAEQSMESKLYHSPLLFSTLNPPHVPPLKIMAPLSVIAIATHINTQIYKHNLLSPLSMTALLDALSKDLRQNFSAKIYDGISSFFFFSFFFYFFIFILFFFFFWFWFSETGFLCVALAVLELELTL